MDAKIIFETALGITRPWYIAAMTLEQGSRLLRIRVDFEVGTRFAVPDETGEYPVDDIVPMRYRDLTLCRLECEVLVHVPWVRLPYGSVEEIVLPEWLEELGESATLCDDDDDDDDDQ